MRLTSIVAAGLMVSLAGLAAGQVAMQAGGGKAPMRVAAQPAVEQVVLQGDRVVVGRVVEMSDPNKMKLALPGRKKPVEGTFVTYTIEVEKSIKPKPPGKDGRDANNVSPERITVIAYGTPKRQAGNANNVNVQVRGGAQVVVRGGGGKPVVLGPGQGGVVPVQGAVIGPRRGPNLKKGRSYIFVLRRFRPGDDRYYLEPTYPWWVPATKLTRGIYTSAADVEGWPWGKAVDGLQLALLRGRTSKLMSIKGTVSAPLPIALRNTGKEALSVVVDKPGERFSVKAFDTDGNSVSGKFIKKSALPKRARSDDEGEDEKPPSAVTLKPGEILILNWGDAGYPGMMRFPIGRGGEYKLQVGYSVDKSSIDAKDRKLWTGSAQSGKRPIEVVTPFDGIRPRPLPRRPMR
ncbi:MAG: hypothetical protein ACLFVH_15005 [Phycisphaerae bacterium]